MTVNATSKWSRLEMALPTVPVCGECTEPLGESFGWCSHCCAAYCFPCGRRHYCKPSCPDNGCHAGLCVRVAEGARISASWGLPKP